MITDLKTILHQELGDHHNRAIEHGLPKGRDRFPDFEIQVESPNCVVTQRETQSKSNSAEQL